MKFFKRRKKPGQTIDAVSEIEEHQAEIQAAAVRTCRALPSPCNRARKPLCGS